MQTSDNIWRAQLDGRVIYQHLTIFEPVLNEMHLNRLAKLIRQTVIASSLVTRLAKTTPFHRTVSYLLLHDFERTRQFIQSQPEFLQLLATEKDNFPCVFYLRDDQFSFASHTDTEKLHNSLKELDRIGLSFFNQLMTGVYLIEERPSQKPTAEEICSGICRLSPRQLSVPQEILRTSAMALLSVWNNIETEVLGSEFDPCYAEQFGIFVALEFESRCNNLSDKKTPTYEPPATPMSKDLWQAWFPKQDRHMATVGSPVNHCVSIEDVLALWKAKK